MARPARIQRRLAIAILLTALIPVLAAVVLAQSMVRQTSERFFVPEIGARLDESLGLYQELARSQKAAMRHQASAIAARGDVRAPALDEDQGTLERRLSTLVKATDGLVSLTVESADEEELAHASRGHPVDEAKEFQFDVEVPLGEGEDAPKLLAVFATSRERFEGRDQMSEFVDTYSTIAERREQDERAYIMAFAVLLGFTIVAAIGVGALIARSVTRRIGTLADATKKVGAGDLDTRVEEEGADEITDLAHAFNRMLDEVETSRARIEYLQRIGAWQEMARRLAHEIKNPLTPIQLAVEEIHQRYGDADESYRKALDATLEVVEAEVGTLRRLVGEFSSFARLPQAKLEPGDLLEFFRDQEERASVIEDEYAAPGSTGADDKPTVEVSFDLPDGAAPVYLDREMLRRAVSNLIRNAAQAITGSGRSNGRVQLTVERAGDFWSIDIDDDGPGIPAAQRLHIFDPYVTTKSDGTGLGLAIVKKILVEHGGSISAHEGPLGGARMRLRIPAADTAASTAALESATSSAEREGLAS